MPRYYCDYCDTYLTHDSQYEAQQNQYLIDQKVKEHLGQAAAFQQVGAAYNQLRPRLPMMPMPGNPQLAMNPALFGMRPPVSLPRPIPGTIAT
ncbi:Zinc finger, U1-C type [Cynara cardunculus var. scolymus]|uniref:Zinc finger, U1-C type n=1 Tax=Cynara cardunculus var. scolymus TaxID=59895 RepID=A0A103DFN7_CYNCS|nr:Zinc finger, U1-C type [Cynara cardunculus var. scolymus]